MTVENIKARLREGAFEKTLVMLYGEEKLEAQKARYAKAIDAFAAQFGGDREISLYSAPGRTEIGGNHTDHNHGRVLAAGVDMDVIAVVARSANGIIRVQSAGYPMDTVDTADLAVSEKDKNHSASLIRGVADGFVRNGHSVGGFDAYTTSNVLKGSGLSSSAAFEVLVGTIVSQEYNDGAADAVEIAKIAQYAENVHFGKPSGLMDQMASSVGGMIAIDFADPSRPVIKKVDFDFSHCGYRLCVVETGGDHADLTHEYAAVPADMKRVALSLGVKFLRDTTMEQLLEKLPELRAEHGDRAVLRAMHFLGDNRRVERQTRALEAGDFDEFLELVKESGHSSFEYLQNVHVPGDVRHQGMAMALCAAQALLHGRGAWRVHGGGFAGTTLNVVPEDMAEEFAEDMERMFGEGCCHTLSIRPVGGIRIA